MPKNKITSIAELIAFLLVQIRKCQSWIIFQF
jgi:hypothetical protein